MLYAEQRQDPLSPAGRRAGFVRHSGRRPDLTGIGEMVLRHAKQILAAACSMEEAVGRATKRNSQRIVFSCQGSLALAMQAILAHFPMIQCTAHSEINSTMAVPLPG